MDLDNDHQWQLTLQKEAGRQEDTFEWKYKHHLQSLTKKVDSELNLVPSSS